LQETTISRRRQKLNAAADGLGFGGAYGEMLSRIERQGGAKSRLGMAALMWISHAERPLKVGELCHALGIEIGSPDLDSDNVPSIETVLACCQGLVAVDQKASTVRLIHFTAAEHLRDHPQLFSTAHSTMAEICLSYLNSHQVKALSACPSPDLSGTPFLEYSSLYWGIHAKRDLSNFAKQIALRLFDNYDNHISTEILLKAMESGLSPVTFNRPSLFSSLHCASFFGIVEIVASLVEAEFCDINQADCTGSTPLAWAASNGHEEVVKILLGRNGVDPGKPDGNDRTPLLSAAENGHGGVVEILLRRDDVNPDKPEWCGRTPLLCASLNGHEGVVEMLLEGGGVNPDKPDGSDRTPLLCAAQNGHEGVVKILLGRNDVSPDKRGMYGRTPFWSAAYHGQEGVVKILARRGDVNPDKPDINGRTPLWGAGQNGHKGVIKFLLGRDDVGPNKGDIYGQTPLRGAAQSGHEGVVKILLRREDVNPDKPDDAAETPLWWAALNGHEGMVQILLGRGDVNPDKANDHGQTPLWCASENGREGVVKIHKNRLRLVESLAVLIPSVLPAASYIYTKLSYRKLLLHRSSPLFHHRHLPSKPRPQLSNRFPPSIPSPVSTTYRPFLNAPSQTFVIPLPVSLLSKCDTRSLHPLANTSSKPLVPLV